MTTTDHRPRPVASPTDAGDGPARSAHLGEYDERVAGLTAAYHRTVDHIMTTRYGPGWATRGDLPDEAYTAEVVFTQWLSDLLDHIDHTATAATSAEGN